MRMLVTGGAGFIGANFVHQTVRQFPEYEVTVIDALTYAGDAASLAPVADKISFVHGDITDEPLVDSLVAANDIVVHFAAESHNDVSIANPGIFVQTNLVGTFRILEAVRRHERRLHHVSTDEVFGDLELDDPQRFSEETPYRPSSPYSATKASADMLVRAWVRTFGIAATISNCSNNYGPYQHVEKFIPRQITNILSGVKPKLYGTGRNVRDWIHVDDHNSAVHMILRDGKAGETYLIGADGGLSNREALAHILDVMGMPADFVDFVDDRPGHDLRYAIDPAKLRAELGWSPRYGSFRDGIEATVAWYAGNRAWWESKKADAETFYRSVGR